MDLIGLARSYYSDKSTKIRNLIIPFYVLKLYIYVSTLGMYMYESHALCVIQLYSLYATRVLLLPLKTHASYEIFKQT